MALTKNYEDADLVKYVMECRSAGEQVRADRDIYTKSNYDMFHLKHDFSHKVAGQSEEILSKLRMSVISTSSFFQQALADITDWFTVEMRDVSVDEGALLLKSHEVKKLLQYELVKAKYFSHIGLCIQRGLLGGVLLSKCSGKVVPIPKFKVKGKKRKEKSVEQVKDTTWRLNFDRISNENFYRDPDSTGIYDIEETYVKLHTVKALAEGEDAIYIKSVVDELSTTYNADAYHDFEKRRETGDAVATSHIPEVKLTEFWGDLISCEGDVLMENCVITIANDTHVIRKPTENPLWHSQRPFVFTQLLEVDQAVWPIALADAGAQHNATMIELYNLILDASFKHVNSTTQVRVQDLVDSSQVSDGIKPGSALLVKSSLPPGAKVMEALEAVDVPGEALTMFNMIQQEYNSSMLTTDLRSGMLPDRAVKATEVVEQSQTLTSIFQGITKHVEQNHIVPELEMAWATIAQNLDKIAKDELISLFGAARGNDIANMDPQDVFVQTVAGYKIAVFGITQTLAKSQDFRKLTTLLQTLPASEMLMEEFIKRYDMGKLLGEVMTALNIDKAKIALPDQPAAPAMPMPSGVPTQAMASVPAPPAPPNLSDLLGGNMSTSGMQGPGGF